MQYDQRSFEIMSRPYSGPYYSRLHKPSAHTLYQAQPRPKHVRGTFIEQFAL